MKTKYLLNYNNMKKSLLLLFAWSFIMSSCMTSYYQMYNVKSELKESNENFVYEDEMCKLTYNLWRGNDNFSFVFENKTNKDVYIHLPNCFMLKNGMAYDYFTERESVYKVAVTGTTSNLMKQSIMEGYTDKQLPIIVIPAGAKKIIRTNQGLFKDIIYVCDNKMDFPKDETKEIVYTKDSTPLTFVNRIAYSFDKNATEYTYINNEFWISGYFNNSSTKTLVYESKKDCHTGITVYETFNKYMSGIRFYNSYNR